MRALNITQGAVSARGGWQRKEQQGIVSNHSDRLVRYAYFKTIEDQKSKIKIMTPASRIDTLHSSLRGTILPPLDGYCKTSLRLLRLSLISNINRLSSHNMLAMVASKDLERICYVIRLECCLLLYIVETYFLFGLNYYHYRRNTYIYISIARRTVPETNSHRFKTFFLSLSLSGRRLCNLQGYCS